MERILLVEDDPAIVQSLTQLLSRQGYAVSPVSTKKDAMALLESSVFDLCLLDVALPDGSGFSVCAAARHTDPGLPVLFLTASDDEMSVVTGLDMGADDYITKPFRPLELLSRIRTALRRRNRESAVITLDGLSVDQSRGKVEKNGREIILSPLEYKLLLLFLTNRGAVLTRENLLSALWDAGGDFVTDNTLSVYIKRLREKCEDDPADPKIFKTVRGVGYKAGD